jgi:hypothetical protein
MNQYISRYSNNKTVSAAQYITELICEKKAQKDKTDLHYRFWEHKKWAAYFRNQIASAHKLLKQYEAKAIINALLSPEAQKIYSLRAPHLVPMIEQAQQILADQQKQSTSFSDSIVRKQEIDFKRQTREHSIISKLKDLDNGA